ncbi:MAG: hypothetical protein WAU86_22965, partial [Oricola sp.]
PLTPQAIGIGALAGATTALLCLGLASGSALAIVLFFISPVPLIVAGLGFGLKSALLGAFIAIGSAFAVANGLVGLLVAFAIALPACATAFWLNLARPAEEIGGPAGKLAWYPLSDILFAVALMTGLAYVVLGAAIGFGPEVAQELTAELVARFQESNPQIVFTAAGEASLRDFLQIAIPVVQPFFWMLTLTLSIYIALAIARRARLIGRPKDDWTQGLRMPRMAIYPFLAAVITSLVPGSIGHAAASFAGALAAGFTMAGFAMLHARSRGIMGRPAILIAAYLSVLFIGFTALAFFIAGMFGAGRHIPLTPANPSNLTPRKKL